MYTINNRVITLAYIHIPEYLNFYVIDNITLVKVITQNKGKANHNIKKFRIKNSR